MEPSRVLLNGRIYGIFWNKQHKSGEKSNNCVLLSLAYTGLCTQWKPVFQPIHACACMIAQYLSMHIPRPFSTFSAFKLISFFQFPHYFRIISIIRSTVVLCLSSKNNQQLFAFLSSVETLEQISSFRGNAGKKSSRWSLV